MREDHHQLIRDYEAAVARQQVPTLNEEDFDILLVHYYSAGDYDRTLEVAEYAVEQYPFAPDFYKWKAIVHKIALDEDGAMAAIDKLLTYTPGDPETHLLHLEILTHFEHVEPAREVLARLEASTQDTDKLSVLAFYDGLLCIQEKHFDGAFHEFCRAIELDPLQEAAYEELINASELTYQQAEIGAFLQELSDREPLNDLVWYYLGLWYSDSARDNEALDAFAFARSLQPDEPRYDLDFADKLFDLKRHESALKVYNAYLQSEGAEINYETYMRIGCCYQELNRIEEARAAFFSAAELDPTMYDIYEHLAETYVLEEKWTLGAYYYGMSIERVHHTANCWLGYALCNSAINEPEEAERGYRRAIAMEPNFSDSIVSFGLFLVEQGREREALEMVEERMEVHRDAPLLYGAVALHLLCARRKEALNLLNDALNDYYDDRDMLMDWHPALRDDRDIAALMSYHAPR